mmetsp:Transcript_4961/g.8715  ORF Transcript_4961/g.8715 Transcript_4961/m.8715 type:complete len:203 (+) Transcript_4961:64-672(+)
MGQVASNVEHGRCCCVAADPGEASVMVPIPPTLSAQGGSSATSNRLEAKLAASFASNNHAGEVAASEQERVLRSLPNTTAPLPVNDQDAKKPEETFHEEEFIVHAQRESGRPLGITVRWNYPDAFIIVKELVPEVAGVFSQWNASNPDQRIFPGYRIMEVNGVSDPQGAVKQLQLANTLVVRVQRAVADFSEEFEPATPPAG